jgi:hypothetical protein
MPSPAAAFPAPRGLAAREPAAPGLDLARERVVRLLTDRYADDSLTVEQFEAHLERMHALASVPALDAMAAELAVPGSGAAARTQAAARRPGGLAGTLPGRVFAFMSQTRRSGAWLVPPRLRLVSVMSEVHMDLREAVLPAECEVEVLALMGNVTLWLPPGARAHVEVDSVMASVHDRGDRVLAPRGPVVRVTGTAVMSDLKVRREDW